jgi:Zn-dependent alcohol dehydrogenase
VQVPRLVSENMRGELPIDHFVSHNLQGIEQTNEAFRVLHGGECIRVVVHY